jgi:hypothetical protein
LKEFCSALLKISPRAYDFMNGFFHFPHKSKIRNFQVTHEDFYNIIAKKSAKLVENCDHNIDPD